MAKYYGQVGFETDYEEYAPGKWRGGLITVPYSGEVIRNRRKTQNAGNVTPDLNVSIEISIVADPFANDNYFNIKFVEYNGARWCVTEVDPQFPRLNLILGGLYHENTSES